MALLVNEFDNILKAPTPIYTFPEGDALAVKQQIAEMFEVMTTNDGIGLAAPQIGSDLRLFIMQFKDERFVCFNPEIIRSSADLVDDLEGCLSFPQLYLKVERPQWIECSYQDETGAKVVKTFDGIMARCFTHELEHLDGITFTQKVGSVSLSMAQKRRSKLQRKSKR